MYTRSGIFIKYKSITCLRLLLFKNYYQLKEIIKKVKYFLLSDMWWLKLLIDCLELDWVSYNIF